MLFAAPEDNPIGRPDKRDARQLQFIYRQTLISISAALLNRNKQVIMVHPIMDNGLESSERKRAKYAGNASTFV